MKIGIISDVHNNIVALNLVLARFRNEDVGHILCAGDIIGIGSSPEETVTRIRTFSGAISSVKGNHESYLIDGIGYSIMNEEERDYHIWEHAQLSDDSKIFLSKLPSQLNLDFQGKSITVIHYAFQGGDYQGIVRDPSKEDLVSMFSDFDSDVIIYGHNHRPSYLVGKSIYINPGSLGCPGSEQDIARAGILTIEKEISYQQINIEYNVEPIIKEMDQLNFPAKDTIKRIFYGVSS